MRPGSANSDISGKKFFTDRPTGGYPTGTSLGTVFKFPDIGVPRRISPLDFPFPNRGELGGSLGLPCGTRLELELTWNSSLVVWFAAEAVQTKGSCEQAKCEPVFPSQTLGTFEDIIGPLEDPI